MQLYIMNEPTRANRHSGKLYLEGILEGCRQNGLSEMRFKSCPCDQKRNEEAREEKRVSWSRSGTIRIKEKE